ncbi:MAG: hypothetical protein CMC08_01640 [Flavobacteriaceae bacterium]|nr:hypothetical protein [Flavobacteriaceae bacterium]
METTVSENQKQVGALLHLSTFAKYFFPLANFFAPLLIWTFNKEKRFIDHHGREAINFQLSVLLYALSICLLCLPFFLIFAVDFISLVDKLDETVGSLQYHHIENLTGYFILFGIVALLLFGLFIFELYAVVTATMHAAKGRLYSYPLCIPFIKTSQDAENLQPGNINQSKNEHTS